MPNQPALTAISATTQSYVDQLWRNIQSRILQMIKSELASQIGSGVQGGKLIATAVAGTLAASAWSPMANNGDMIYQTSGSPARLPIGVSGQTLQVVNNAPSWTFGSASTSALTVPVSGDFQLVYTTQGDLITTS